MSSKKYQKINIFDFDTVYNRVLESTDIKNQSDLALVVGVTQGAVSGWKSKKIWPEEWAFRIGQKYDFLTEWILTGKGPKRIGEPIKLKRHHFDFLEDLEDWLLELIAKEPDRAEWAKHCISDALPAFREWKKKKEPNVMEEGDYPQDKVA